MDPALLVTYKTVLDAFQRRCKGDTSSATGDELELMADYLTEAMEWAWKFPGQPWPVTIEPMTVTLVDGVIPWSTVYYANWWLLFKDDPRPTPRHCWPRPIPGRRDATGIWPNLEGFGHHHIPSEVFVLFQRRSPEFGNTPVVRITEYAVGDVVFDGVDNIVEDSTKASGQCYRALLDDVTGGQCYDPTKWERQEIPRFLKGAVLNYARGVWMPDQTEEDKAPTYEEKAGKMLETEWFNQKEEG